MRVRGRDIIMTGLDERDSMFGDQLAVQYQTEGLYRSPSWPYLGQLMYVCARGADAYDSLLKRSDRRA